MLIVDDYFSNFGTRLSNFGRLSDKFKGLGYILCQLHFFHLNVPPENVNCAFSETKISKKLKIFKKQPYVYKSIRYKA